MGSPLLARQLLRHSRRRELGDKYFLKLRQVIPYTLVTRSYALAATRGDSAAGDSRLARGSQAGQKERDLLLKVSGFRRLVGAVAESALGADCPTASGRNRIDHALTNFAIQPTILQQFNKGNLFVHLITTAKAARCER